MELESYRDLVLLQRLGALYLELERLAVVPFAVRSSGLEAVAAGAVGLLGEQDWIYPDARTGWGCALLRGQGLTEHLHQWLGTGQDVARGRVQPGFGGNPAGRVVPVSQQLGLRARQALGTAWSLRAGEGDSLCACILGPSELERPEALDALLRAGALGAPLLGVLVGPAQLCAQWTRRLSAQDVPWAGAPAGDLDRILTEGQPMAARVRAERMPAALVLEEAGRGRRGRELLEQAAAKLRWAEDRAQLASVRLAVAASIREALGEALGSGRAHQVLAGLGAAWS